MRAQASSSTLVHEELLALLAVSRLEGGAALLLFGGFALFNAPPAAGGRLLAVHSLSVSAAAAAPPIALSGPIPCDAELLTAMESHGRMQQVPLPGLRQCGYRRFGWIHATKPLCGEVKAPLPACCPLGALLFVREAAPAAEGTPPVERSEEAVLYALTFGSSSMVPAPGEPQLRVAVDSDAAEGGGVNARVGGGLMRKRSSSSGLSREADEGRRGTMLADGLDRLRAATTARQGTTPRGIGRRANSSKLVGKPVASSARQRGAHGGSPLAKLQRRTATRLCRIYPSGSRFQSSNFDPYAQRLKLPRLPMPLQSSQRSPEPTMLTPIGTHSQSPAPNVAYPGLSRPVPACPGLCWPCMLPRPC